jgi:hypothetical protein
VQATPEIDASPVAAAFAGSLTCFAWCQTPLDSAAVKPSNTPFAR